MPFAAAAAGTGGTHLIGQTAAAAGPAGQIANWQTAVHPVTTVDVILCKPDRTGTR